MSWIWLKCTECEEEGEVYCDGDGPMRCPNCRSIDCFVEIESEEEEEQNLEIVK